MEIKMFTLKLSAHKDKHAHEKWNQETIKEAYENGLLKTFRAGLTADVIFGNVNGDEIGMVVTKEKSDGTRVIITAFKPKDPNYWYNC